MMDVLAKIRLELPTDLEKELNGILINNRILFDLIPDTGGLKSTIIIFEITVGVATLIQTGLQIYEFLRGLKKKTSKSHKVVLETKSREDVNINIRVEINPNIPRPVITDRLLELQKALS